MIIELDYRATNVVIKLTGPCSVSSPCPGCSEHTPKTSTAADGGEAAAAVVASLTADEAEWVNLGLTRLRRHYYEGSEMWIVLGRLIDKLAAQVGAK